MLTQLPLYPPTSQVQSGRRTWQTDFFLYITRQTAQAEAEPCQGEALFAQRPTLLRQDDQGSV
jgi:hypothetical protein